MTNPKEQQDKEVAGQPGDHEAASLITKLLDVNRKSMPNEVVDLLGQLDRDQVSWNPNVGDEVVGKVLSITPADSAYGRYPLLMLDVPNGPICLVHAFHAILRNEIDKLGVVENDTIAIRYLGRDGSKEMARYRVALRRGPGGKGYDPTATAVTVAEEPF